MRKATVAAGILLLEAFGVEPAPSCFFLVEGSTPIIKPVPKKVYKIGAELSSSQNPLINCPLQCRTLIWQLPEPIDRFPV
jgi:hypothetical protein